MTSRVAFRYGQVLCLFKPNKLSFMLNKYRNNYGNAFAAKKKHIKRKVGNSVQSKVSLARSIVIHVGRGPDVLEKSYCEHSCKYRGIKRC